MRLTSIFVALFCLLAFCALGQTPIKKFQSITTVHTLNDKLLLYANDGNSGDELWVSDGTAGGTKLLKDIRPGYPGSAVENIFNYKGKAYFAAFTDEFQSELWVTDGTTEGTKIFADLTAPEDYNGGTTPGGFTVFQEMLYFTSIGGKLYRTNENPGSIEIVDQTEYSRIAFLNVVGDRLYYYKGSDILHWTNGTSKGDIDLPLDLEDTYFKGLFSTGNTLYAMRASTYDEHIKLYVLNNTTFTWTKIFDLKAPVYGDHEIDKFTVVGDKLFFNLRKDYENVKETEELWVATGTTTEMLKSFDWDRHSAGSSMQNLVAFGDQLCFRAGFSAGRALWKSDGTVNGTVKVHDVEMVAPYNIPNPPLVLEQKFYFAGITSQYQTGAALWSSDGTTAGTKKELDLASNLGGTPYFLAAKQEEVYFVTSVEQFSVTLWSSAASGDINIASSPGGPPLAYPGTISINPGNETCKVQQIEIRNDGSKALAMGSARVNGGDYMISGDIPAILPPGAKFNLDILYYPASTDKTSGVLTIESSDDNESPYTINLGPPGALSTAVPGFCSTFSDKFRKVISPTRAQQSIRLSNYTIKELQPAGSSVGTLSLATGNAVSYTLVAGEGDNDNASFTIDGTTLKTKRAFVYYKKNNYLVRIQASLADGQSVVAAFMIEIENTIDKLSFDACEKRTERLDYQFMSIAKNSVGHLFVATNSGLIQQSIDGGVTWKVTDADYPASINRIFFVGKKGFALGNVLLKSEDDGATWFQVYVPGSLSNGSSIHFLDESKGYISVTNGGVYFTSDGAQNWTQRRQFLSFSDGLNNLQFVDESKGFGSWSSDLVQTLDGGRTWTKIDLSSLGYSLGYIMSIRFINKDEGFVLTSSALLTTVDGGKTWAKATLPISGEMRSMKFIDTQTLYVFGTGFLIKSTDKGLTWSSHTPLQYSVADLVESNSTLYAIHGNLSTYGTGRALIRSIDNGSTWQTLQAIGNAYHRAIDFPTDNFGFIISESGSYRTTDGGVSWKPTDWTQKMNSAYFFDANNGILSDSENMYKTTDGGQTITRVFTIEPVENEYRVFGTTYAVSEDVLLNYGWGTLARSADKGITWEFMDMQGLNVQDIQFVSPSIGYIVGLFGDVYQTENGGETWVHKFESDPNDFDVANTIFFLPDGIGFRGGETFSKSVDGGATWTDIFTSFRQKIRKLWFDSEDHGFAICEGASFFETSDGGKTWKEHYIFNGDTPSFVRFRNGNIYFVGDEGYIAQYKNKGPAPLKPGYISGKTTACVGDIQTYYLPENRGYLYQWAADGINVIEQPSSLQAYFQKEGKYTFTVTAVNACGTSESRSLPVTVVAGQKPIISGEKKSPTGQKETYEIQNSKSTATYQWSLSPTVLFADSEQGDKISLTWPTTPGSFTIHAIGADAESGCRVLSDAFNVEVTIVLGVDDPSDALSMYPNPASKVMVVASETTLLYNAEIYTLNGTLLMETSLKPGVNNTIHIDDLSPGVYVIKIQGEDDKVFRRKFVKQ
ncbi:MAG TPA: YCF48-related protein [Cyclobacteriaceae bacterium]|nr:YCF48-related protein [Cyclobacteriaceae bacterium]